MKLKLAGIAIITGLLLSGPVVADETSSVAKSETAKAKEAKSKSHKAKHKAAAVAAGAAAGTTAVAAKPAEAKVDMVAGQALAQRSACMTCHAVDKKVVGPAYKDVAAKYKGDKTAEAKLIEKVKKGGGGVWGTIPMPPNSQVKDDDIKTLVKWVLAH